MPLVFAPTNTLLKILRVAVDDKTRKHLESLGIASGGNMVLLSSGGGSVVCKVQNGRLALDGKLSSKIFVVEQPNDNNSVSTQEVK